MELVRGLHNLRPRHRGCVATIGNFDGLHRGHGTVIGQLREVAARHALPVTVILFEPQPQEYFARDHAPARLMRLHDKLEGLRELGVERVLCLRFSDALAALSADQFIERVLVSGLGVKHLVVGDDFRFGKGRAGDFHLLVREGARQGFTVEHMHTFELDGERVSSTRVREALAAGDYAEAKRLLGRPYAITGRVTHGSKLGRTIGFPTANVPMRRNVSAVTGIFAVRLYGEGVNGGHPGVAYVGRRPTVNGIDERLEVHLFDFEGDLYGRRIRADLLAHLREDRRFDSVGELTAQIQRDAEAARAYFENAS
ncbi:MAG: bifunctional riboflavin kinase/FAD synthetase [Gammaproteobacteria bacterium]